MDIEGAEIEIIDNCTFNKISKLVFAYHIKHDSSKQNFLNRMNKLKQYFDIVHYQKLPDKEILDFFPNEIIVYCMNNIL